jgi:hypothetical protein
MLKTARVVIQNIESSCYFNVRNSWTNNPEHALEFEDRQDALRFCEERSLDASRFRIVECNS